jgi:hypothetical protein
MQYLFFIFSLPLWVRLKTSHLQNAFESQRVALENGGIGDLKKDGLRTSLASSQFAIMTFQAPGFTWGWGLQELTQIRSHFYMILDVRILVYVFMK